MTCRLSSTSTGNKKCKREVFARLFQKGAVCRWHTDKAPTEAERRPGGGWGRGAPVAHELAPTEPAGETQSPILLCEAIFSGCFPLLNQKKIPRSPFRELPERLRGNFYVCWKRISTLCPSKPWISRACRSRHRRRRAAPAQTGCSGKKRPRRPSASAHRPRRRTTWP